MTAPRLEVRYQADSDGTEELDEVIAERAHVHLERMGDAQWWLGITIGKRTHHINIGAINPRAKGYGWVEVDND